MKAMGKTVGRSLLRSAVGGLLLCVCVTTWSAQALQIGTSVLKPYTTTERQGFLDHLMAAVFNEIGLKAEVLVYAGASERSLIQANEGVDDGQALRIGGLTAQYPNLVQVPEPVLMNDFVVMMRRGESLSGTGWNALQGKSVAYLLGWKVFEANVPPQALQTKVREAGQLFSLLKQGRVDVVLYERWQGLQEARDAALDVEVVGPPLTSVPMYMYLNKKHADLVPKAAQALARLKQDGRYQRIQTQTLKP